MNGTAPGSGPGPYRTRPADFRDDAIAPLVRPVTLVCVRARSKP
jgi:hypothetical protein